jgi:hypothetical protein
MDQSSLAPCAPSVRLCSVCSWGSHDAGSCSHCAQQSRALQVSAQRVSANEYPDTELPHTVTIGRKRIICRVEHLGTWLDLVIVAGGLNFTLLGVQALRTVRSRKYTAHRHWSLLHIAAGHGVNTQRVLIMLLQPHIPKHLLASADNRKLMFSAGAAIGTVLNMLLVEVYLQLPDSKVLPSETDPLQRK